MLAPCSGLQRGERHHLPPLAAFPARRRPRHAAGRPDEPRRQGSRYLYLHRLVPRVRASRVRSDG